MVDLQPLIHTHKGLSISLRNFSSNPWERVRVEEEEKECYVLSSQEARGRGVPLV